MDDIQRCKTNFPSQAPESDPSPELKTMAYVDKANKEYESLSTVAEKKIKAQSTGCKGTYALRSLSHHDRILDTPIDPMHLIKNIVEHLVKLIVGVEDSVKVRKQEQELHRFSSAWLSDRHTTLRGSPFTLSTEEISLANERLKQVKVPSRFDWNTKPFFSKPYVMKSHQWKQVAVHGVLKYCLRDMLGSTQRQSLFNFLDVLSLLCAEEVDMQAHENLNSTVHKALVLIERDFPLSLQVIVVHLLHHLPKYISRFGPVYNFWMYPYERFNSWVTRRVMSRRFPESTVIETYRLSEWAHFMELSGQLPDGAVLTPLASRIDTQESMSEDEAGLEFELDDDVLLNLKILYDSVVDETSFVTNIQRTALRRKYVTRTTASGRLINISSTEKDMCNSYVSNSHVSSSVTGKVMIGRILSIFDHKLTSVSRTFAYMSWFEGPYLDKQCKLNYVLCNVQTQSVVLLSSLSNPYVTALDEQEPEKLWILNL